MSETNPNLEKLKEWLSLVKFTLGTFLLGAIGLLLDNHLKNRQLEIQEMQSVGNYMQYVLTKDVGDRKRFSEYFAAVSRSDEMRERWKAYDDIVTIEYQKDQRLKDSLNRLIQKDFVEKNEQLSKIKSLAKGNEVIYKEEKEKIETQFERRSDSLQYLLNRVESKLAVTNLETPKEEVGAVVTVPKRYEAPIARAIVKFLFSYPRSCFNVARIRDWGGEKKEHRALLQYSYNEISESLDRLLADGIVIQGECKIKDLYSISMDQALVSPYLK